MLFGHVRLAFFRVRQNIFRAKMAQPPPWKKLDRTPMTSETFYTIYQPSCRLHSASQNLL